VQKGDVPLVDARLLIKTGGEADPPNLSGLADMTASLLTKGTKTRSAVQIARGVEALGATLESGAMWDASFVTINVASSNLSKALGYLADVVQNPLFAKDEIERLRAQNLDALQVSMHQPGDLARFVAARGREAGFAHVLPAGAITRGSLGEQLADMAELKDAGCVCVTDDGRPVMSAGVMRRALEYAFDVLGEEKVISVIHPENAASIRVAEKIGERFDRTEDVRGQKRLIYSVARRA